MKISDWLRGKNQGTTKLTQKDATSQQEASLEKQPSESVPMPNIGELKLKRDFAGLGNYLRHNDVGIRKESTQALLDLLKNTDRSTRSEITNQFSGINDKDILSVCIQRMTQIMKDSLYRESSAVLTTICQIICNIEDGFDELIEFNKNNSTNSYYWNSRAQADVSECLVEFASSGGVSMDIWLCIIPYANCGYSGGMKQGADYLQWDAPEIEVSKEKFEETQTQINKISFLNGCGNQNYGKTLGKFLLEKMRIVSEK
jgi:hypothetical protein